MADARWAPFYSVRARWEELLGARVRVDSRYLSLSRYDCRMLWKDDHGDEISALGKALDKRAD